MREKSKRRRRKEKGEEKFRNFPSPSHSNKYLCAPLWHRIITQTIYFALITLISLKSYLCINRKAHFFLVLFLQQRHIVGRYINQLLATSHTDDVVRLLAGAVKVLLHALH